MRPTLKPIPVFRLRRLCGTKEGERSKQSASQECQTRARGNGTTTGQQTGRAPPVLFSAGHNIFLSSGASVPFRSAPRHRLPCVFHKSLVHARHDGTRQSSGETRRLRTPATCAHSRERNPNSRPVPTISADAGPLRIEGILLFVSLRCANITACAVCRRNSLSMPQCYCAAYSNCKRNNSCYGTL